ncbi:MAG TPA: ABC transporter substrate-binding protein, partial [Candidatus Binatia bacterium]|nr:ABC transporter substrate-binding protein [Candidatus Binatia bacterium]
MKLLKKDFLHRARALLAAVVIALIALTYVGSSGAAEPKTGTIRLDFIIGGKHAPWFVALEKGFYAKRGLTATIQAGSGSADTVRAIAAGGADFGFADISTAIVARSRGTPVQVVGQFGYVPTTIMWREDTPIKQLKDLEGKSWAISPGQAQWYLMPAYARINKIDFKSIKIQETAAPLQPAALVAKRTDFIVMYRASNDEVAEIAATKQGMKLNRIFMKDTGLDIYGTGLIVKDEDLKQ